MFIISIDIGSTWTKGALFELQDDRFITLARSQHRTSNEALIVSFKLVLSELKANIKEPTCADTVQIKYSSSAKGGLAVAAIGLVPRITLEAAKLAAFSAGARVEQHFSYELSNGDISALEHSAPDIILLTGGTDGGNKEYVLENSQKLAASNLDCHIIYAGNRSLVDQIEEILKQKALFIVDNILPEIDVQSPERVREAIRRIFIDQIVFGKGLDEIVKLVGSDPLPTPYVVHDLVGYICEHVEGWGELVLLDLGGATTDVYSYQLPDAEAGVVYRGLAEFSLKRTVEGDLGMRVIRTGFIGDSFI